MMKYYEIWIGDHSLGQGSIDPTEPQKVGTVKSINFKTACIKYELVSKLERIVEGEELNDLNSQDYPWWFDENKVSNSWTGKYYETKEDALKSFTHYKKY